jgi:hypothetical protein
MSDSAHNREFDAVLVATGPTNEDDLVLSVDAGGRAATTTDVSVSEIGFRSLFKTVAA